MMVQKTPGVKQPDPAQSGYISLGVLTHYTHQEAQLASDGVGELERWLPGSMMAIMDLKSTGHTTVSLREVHARLCGQFGSRLTRPLKLVDLHI